MGSQGPDDSTRKQRRLRSDIADVPADLNLRWADMPTWQLDCDPARLQSMDQCNGIF